MCEQCLTNMLSVYNSRETQKRELELGEVYDPSEERYSSFYIGIARAGYMDEYEAGDVFVGRCNGPDMVIIEDLFTEEEWRRGQEIENEEWEQKRIEALGEDYRLRDLKDSPFSSDRFVWGGQEGNIFDRLTNWWAHGIRIADNFNHEFGHPPECFDSMWTAYVVTEAARVFQERGIPLDRDSRLEWANQFPDDISSVRLNSEETEKCGDRVFEIYQTVRVDKEGDDEDYCYEQEWVSWRPSETSDPKEVL